ncbi:MAG: bestrophin family protein [Microcystaceae cyanobacterium]
MIKHQKKWLRDLWQWQVSVIPAILPRVLICVSFALIVTVFYNLGVNQLALPITGSIVPSIVLGLLLVFRTNTAYDRFWEGRKAWGTMINTTRNLTRNIWISVSENSEQDREEKIITLRLVVAFAVAMKLSLRGETVNNEFIDLMPTSWHKKLKAVNHPPLEISFWIGDYLQRKHQEDKLNTYQLTANIRLLDNLVDMLGVCERILKTPIPIAYSIHLKQLVLIYCLTLPLEFIDELNWQTAPVVGLISFTIFGIEEIGREIENPFGYDANDLPLDQICSTMKRNVEDLITLAPSLRHEQTLD